MKNGHAAPPRPCAGASYNSPWQTLNSREVYKNPWIRLREDSVITPSGGKGIYSVVEAHAAIAIVPLTDDLHTWLVGQYRYPLHTYSWEIPEGGGLPDECTLQGARRELMEETGLRAARWTYLGDLYTSNCFTNEVGYVYLAEQLTPGPSQPDATESLCVKKTPFALAWQMVQQGDIKDALAVIALTRVYFYLKKVGRISY